MDTIDFKIMSYLGENSRLSNREIARRIGIAEGTVRNRLERLTNEGILHTTALVNHDRDNDRLQNIF